MVRCVRRGCCEPYNGRANPVMLTFSCFHARSVPRRSATASFAPANVPDAVPRLRIAEGGWPRCDAESMLALFTG